MKRSNLRWGMIAASMLGVGLGSDVCFGQAPPPGPTAPQGPGGGSASGPSAPGAPSGPTAPGAPGGPSAPGGPAAGGSAGANMGATIGPKKPPGYPDGSSSGSEKFAPGGPNGPKGPGGGAGAGGSGAFSENGGPGGAGGPGMAGGPGGENVKHDYKSPVKGAESFLSAVKSRKLEDVVQALAKRSEYEAEPKKQGMFKEILHNENNNAAEYVGQLASEFEGMSVQGMNDFKSSASVKVIVGKTTKNSSVHRTLTMRHEKDGWKVQDYGNLIEMKSAVGVNTRKKR